MTVRFNLPKSAQIYLQPTGFCSPNYQKPNTWFQVAGLPIWANAVRIIARDYGERIEDRTIPCEQIEDLLSTLERPDVAAQWDALRTSRTAWEMGGRRLSFETTKLMGIINATPDSFSDGGNHFHPEAAIAAAQTMVSFGANLLDIGGESTRPGAKTVWEGDEIDRVSPVLAGCSGLGVPLSLDTRKEAVMEQGLNAGAHIINDVSALTYDPASLELMAGESCPIILMHAQGDPQSMQKSPSYEDVVLDVYDALSERISACEAAGINRARLCIDPGIGFGKTLKHNLALINNIGVFHSLGCPILLGVSRKRFIGALAQEEDAKKRLPGSITAALAGLSQGVHILRAHDVAETRQMLDVWSGLRDEQQMPDAL